MLIAIVLSLSLSHMSVRPGYTHDLSTPFLMLYTDQVMLTGKTGQQEPESVQVDQ